MSDEKQAGKPQGHKYEVAAPVHWHEGQEYKKGDTIVFKSKEKAEKLKARGILR